jgi:hypothetical protein
MHVATVAVAFCNSPPVATADSHGDAPMKRGGAPRRKRTRREVAAETETEAEHPDLSTVTEAEHPDLSINGDGG